MKKFLLASTALVATASVAAAEVKFSGLGRFGIGYQEDRSSTTTFTSFGPDGVLGTADDGESKVTVDSNDAILVSRFRLDIDGIVETDGGVEFSARVRLQADENSSTGEADEAKLNGARFSVIYGGLRVDAGNVGGAFDNLANYYGNEVGLESFAGQYSAVDYSVLGYSTGATGHNAVFFKYEVGNFAVAASYDQRAKLELAGSPTGGIQSVTGSTSDNDRWDISAAYTFGNITAAVAHGQTDSGSSGDDPSLTVFTLGGEFGDLAATLFIADDKTEKAATDGSAYGVSAAYTVGATKLLVAYGDGGADDDTQWIGVGAHYDLGGGASLRGGIGRKDQDSGEDKMSADFGAHFDF